MPQAKYRKPRTSKRVLRVEEDIMTWLKAKYPHEMKSNNRFSPVINSLLRKVMLSEENTYNSLQELRTYLESQDLHIDQFAKALLKHLSAFLDSRKKK